MTAVDVPASPRTAEGLLSLAGAVVLLAAWSGFLDARGAEVGAQLLLGALGWRCGRGWAMRDRGVPDGLEPDGTRLAGVVLTVSLSLVLQLLFAQHTGGTRDVPGWRGAASPFDSTFGHLWILGAAVMLVGGATLAQRVVESVTPDWRFVMVAGSCAVAGLSLGSWFSSASSTVDQLLGLGSSAWGFSAALAAALIVPTPSDVPGKAAGAGHPSSWSIVPLTTVHERPSRWLWGALLWAWPAVSMLAPLQQSDRTWLPLLVVASGTAVGGWVVTLCGGWPGWSSTLGPATRRAIGVSVVGGLVLVGTSTAVSAGGVIGGPGLRTSPAALLQVAVPDLDVVVPRPLEVFLVGDSTMAPMRWFRQGRASLGGFDYVLDVESCRRIAKRSCWGRESRIPTSATLAVTLRRRDFDFVVLMAGAHSTRRDLADEVRMAQQAAQDHGAKLLIVTLRESLQYTEIDGPPGESAFVEFNRIIRSVAEELGPEKVALIDWNEFSIGEPSWFRSDGIHPNLTGTIALGWLISRAVAAEAGNPCPTDWTYPCSVPRRVDAGRDWLAEFGVVPTDEHCYEDGNSRVPICQRDRRM